VTLLERSSYRLSPANHLEVIDEAAEQMILGSVCHKLSFDELLLWLKQRIRRK
jgi:hypothetical protein